MLTRRRILQIFVLLGLVLALGWSAIVNRGPFYCPDTLDHLHEADYVFSKIFHKPTLFNSTDKTTFPFAPRHIDSRGADVWSDATYPNFAVRGFSFGRSIYYSMWLYADALLGTRWLTISMQSLAVLLTICLLMNTLNVCIWPNLLYVTVALCAVSDVSFFVSFLKPDVFAGIGLMATAVLITGRDAMGWKTNILWLFLLTISMVYCDTAAAVSAVLLALSVSQDLLMRSWSNRRGILTILLALGVSFASTVVYSSGMRQLTGRAPLRLPFLEARLIGSRVADSYLQSTCPASRFTVCDYLGELPLDSTEFLFSITPGKSIYGAMPYEKRKAIGEQQSRFAWEVIRYAPIQITKTILRDIRVLLPRHELLDFTNTDYFRRAIEEDFPERLLSQVRATLVYRDHFSLRVLVRIFGWVELASVLYLGSLLFRKNRNSERNAAMKPMIFWVGIGLVINVVICATLSGPFERYESRMLWLLPLLAFVLHLSQRSMDQTSTHGSALSPANHDARS